MAEDTRSEREIIAERIESEVAHVTRGEITDLLSESERRERERRAAEIEKRIRERMARAGAK